MDTDAAARQKLAARFNHHEAATQAAQFGQDIGSYKPALRNFEDLLDRLGADDRAEGGDDNLMVAQSLFHGHLL